MSSRGWKYTLWLLLAVAIIHHGVYAWKVAVLNHDKSEMVGAAVSLLEGNGYTYVVANPNQLAKPIHTPLIARPPGYSSLLVPLVWATRDIWLSTVLLDIVATVVFYVAWYFILNALGSALSNRAKLLVWVMWALIWSPLLLQSSPELVTLACFSVAIALALSFARQQRHPIRFGILSGLMIGVVGASRLAYWPLLPVVPLGLLTSSGRRISQRLIVGIVLQVLVAAFMLAGVLLFQRASTGQFLHLPVVPGVQRGFFPEQLATIYPFPTSTIGGDVVVNLVKEALGLPETLANVALWVMSALILAAATYACVRSFRGSSDDQARADNDTVSRCFGVMALATGLLTLLMLAYISVSFPVTAALREGRLWISISRFYVPILPFLLVYLAMVIFPTGNWQISRTFKALRIACLTVLIPTILLAVVCRVEFWNLTYRNGPPVAYADNESRTILSSMQDIARARPDITTTLIYPAEGAAQSGSDAVGITDRDGLLANLGRMTGIGTLAANFLPVRGLNIAEDSVLLLYCPREPHTRDGKWLAELRERFDAKKIPANDTFDWYSVKVDEAVLDKLTDVEAFGLLEIAARAAKDDKLDEAMKHYQEALAWNPFLLDTHMGIGNVQMRQQRYAEAEASFRRAVSLKADYAVAYKQLGMALLVQKRPEEAAENFRLALMLDPDDAEARQRLTEATQASSADAP